MPVKISGAVSLLVTETVRLLVNDACVAQLKDAYGGEGKTLTVNNVMPTINGGFLCELIVEMVVGGYKSLNVYICLFDKDGHMGSTIKEDL